MNTTLNQPNLRRALTDRLNCEDNQLAISLEGEPGPTPAGKTPHTIRIPELDYWIWLRTDRSREHTHARTYTMFHHVCEYNVSVSNVTTQSTNTPMPMLQGLITSDLKTELLVITGIDLMPDGLLLSISH